MTALQKLIDKCAKTGDAHFRAKVALDDYCIAIYGVSPSDVDCDNALDNLYGNAGTCSTMPEAQFDTDMREAILIYNRTNGGL